MKTHLPDPLGFNISLTTNIRIFEESRGRGVYSRSPVGGRGGGFNSFLNHNIRFIRGCRGGG